jgi:hypothetical protein
MPPSSALPDGKISARDCATYYYTSPKARSGVKKSFKFPLDDFSTKLYYILVVSITAYMSYKIARRGNAG